MPESVPLTPRHSSDGSNLPTAISLARTPSSRPTSASSSPDRPPAPFNHPTSSSGDEESAAEESGERSPMLKQWNEESPTEERGLPRWEEEETGSASGSRLSGQWESSWEEEGRRRASGGLSKGQKRRVYGGGRVYGGKHEEGAGLGVGEVAGMVMAGMLSPTPLILPHAAALLGLPLFLPLLFLTGALSWFSYVVLGVEARYVGARSWPSLASAVFPHRLKLHRLGELFASCLVLLVSIARGTASVVAASEILVDVLLPDGGQRWWERAACSGAIALVWVLLPTVVLPLLRSRRPSSPTPSSLARTPPYLAFLLWPIALLILGVRLKTLNTLPSPTPPATPPSSREVMGLSIWGGVSILVFSLSAHQNTFKYFHSLARPPSTASRAVRTPSISRVAGSAAAPKDGRPEGRRNQWPFAAALGVGGATIIQMGWGLVGYLGIDGGGREGNLFASPVLVRGDGWLLVVRFLVLAAIFAELEASLEPAYGRLGKGLKMRWRGGERERVDGRNGAGARRGREEERWDWRDLVARVGVWTAVVGVAVGVSTVGVEGEGLVSIAEVAGCVGSTLLAFMCPSLFFIALFHLRRPRSIFISDPSAPVFATDALLMRKEREVQRRLSGRRIWQDVLVFGGLLPFGTVVLIRGCIALATKED